MPQSSPELRAKFADFMHGNDGIATCENIIRKAGATVSAYGVINIPFKVTKELRDQYCQGDKKAHTDFWDAVQFLLEEWDYAYEEEEEV